MFDIPSEEILALYQPDDTHNSNTRVREFWKYGTSVGMSGTPQAFVNGVMLEEYPTSTDEWMAIFNELYPSSEENLLSKAVDSYDYYGFTTDVDCYSAGHKCLLGEDCCTAFCNNEGICL